eukprot:gene30371-37574_t
MSFARNCMAQSLFLCLSELIVYKWELLHLCKKFTVKRLGGFNRLAMKSFCLSQANEELLESQIVIDFHALDTNKNDSVSFSEVCNYCCQYIDPKRSEILFKVAHTKRASQAEELMKVIHDQDFSRLCEEKMKSVEGHKSAPQHLLHGAESHTNALDRNGFAI